MHNLVCTWIASIFLAFSTEYCMGCFCPRIMAIRSGARVGREYGNPTGGKSAGERLLLASRPTIPHYSKK